MGEGSKLFDRLRAAGRGVHRAAWALAGLLLCAAAGAETYSIGVVPQFESRRMIAIWQPLVDELERRTGYRFDLRVPLTVSDFERELEGGSYDIVYANPYHILRVIRSQNYVPMVRDKLPLRGILVVRQDSPVHSPKELAGKTLAVPSPNALGASLLLRADLEHVFGVKMQMLNVKTHSSVYLNVVNELAAAGGGVEKTLAEQDPPVRDALRVLYTTRDMPSHPIAAHPRIGRAARERIQQALLELAAAPAGRRLYDEIPMQEPVTTAIDEYRPMLKWGLDGYWVGGAK